MDMWWSAEQANELGGWVGAGVGIVGGLFGSAMGLLIPRGKGRSFMIPAHVAITFAGVAMLIVGVIALAMSQPFHVYFPLLLCGGITAISLGCLLPVTLNGYRASERRRMDACSLRES